MMWEGGWWVGVSDWQISLTPVASFPGQGDHICYKQGHHIWELDRKNRHQNESVYHAVVGLFLADPAGPASHDELYDLVYGLVHVSVDVVDLMTASLCQKISLAALSLMMGNLHDSELD